MHAIARILGALALAVWWAVLPAMPASAASASSLTGCSGKAVSYDGDGEVLDAAEARGGQLIDTTDGTAAFTKSNPFVVDNDGVVVWEASTDAVITDHDWYLEMFGVKVVTGGDDNADRKQADDGEFRLGDELPVKFTGLVQVSGALEGTGGECVGDGYVKVQGAPFANPVVWAGAAFAGLGALALVLSMPRVVPVAGAPTTQQGGAA